MKYWIGFTDNIENQWYCSLELEDINTIRPVVYHLRKLYTLKVSRFIRKKFNTDNNTAFYTKIFDYTRINP